MCGIFGWLGSEVNPELASNLLDSLKYRGPDDRGEWFNPIDNVYIGQRRLTIIDNTKTGQQPMISKCGRYILSYNGEIYNYKELRNFLEKENLKFSGSSDTEVLLNSIIYWDISNALKKLDGMFAFALFDRKKRLLTIARDFMGIKPIFYIHKGYNFAFSSEIRQLKELPFCERSLDSNSVHDYFKNGYISGEKTIYKEIKSLPSGEYLQFKDDSIIQKKYWDLAKEAKFYNNKSNFKSINEAAEDLEKSLLKSVKLHMQSDVPYGAFLSGGIDSALIVSLMQKLSNNPIKTFTIGFKEKSHDESVYAKKISNYLKTDHRELLINSNNVSKLMPKITDIIDQPFADNSLIPTFMVSRLAKESVKVCLSGDGGDEFFGGYPRYFWADRIEKIRKIIKITSTEKVLNIIEKIPNYVFDRLIDPLTFYKYTSSSGLSKRVKRFSKYLKNDKKIIAQNMFSVWEDTDELLGNISSDLLNNFSKSELNNIMEDLQWSNNMMLLDQRNYLQNDILRKLDCATMQASLEGRVPIICKEIFYKSWAIPNNYKFSRYKDSGKLILKKILSKYLPHKYYDRPKYGFGLPMDNWLRDSLKDWGESIVFDENLEKYGLNSKLINHVWEEHQNGKNQQSKLWSVFIYVDWCRKNL